MEQKRFKKVVEREESWWGAIIMTSIGLLLFFHGYATYEMLSDIGCIYSLLETSSAIVSLIGFVFTLIGIIIGYIAFTTKKIYWVEVKE